MKKIPVGILGATGVVGQHYLLRLADHPEFEVVYLAASERSAGQTYEEATLHRWHQNEKLPEKFKNLLVYPLAEQCQAMSACKLLFSALENETARLIEPLLAARGFVIVSNASWSRKEKDIPVIIPEVNTDHLAIIPHQQRNRSWKGFIVTKPCCTVQTYLMALAAIHKEWPLSKVFVASMQAVSGAGWPGTPSLDILDNVIPFIRGEEEKCEEEPLKILGHIQDNQIAKNSHITFSAHCNRVPVVNGHLACISFAVAGKPPEKQAILNAWSCFQGEAQKLKLFSAPKQPLLYFEEEDRPQTRKDRDQGAGMATSLGRLRHCPLFHFRFVCLSHNTVRGAAGGGVLNAELLLEKGLL